MTIENCVLKWYNYSVKLFTIVFPAHSQEND